MEELSAQVKLIWTSETAVAVRPLGAAGIVSFVALQLARAGGDGFAGVGLALVLGGAIGNIIDRVLRGEVVDFLDFYLATGGREHHWPAFNVADSAISIGACCVILAEILTQFLKGGPLRMRAGETGHKAHV